MSNTATMLLSQTHRDSPHFQEHAVKGLKDIGERKEGELYSPLAGE